MLDGKAYSAPPYPLLLKLLTKFLQILSENIWTLYSFSNDEQISLD